MSAQAKKPKRPRDLNQLAAAIVGEATAEPELETCPDCDGAGVVEVEDWRDGELVGKVEVGCQACKGMGRREVEPDESPAAKLGRKGGLKGGRARAEKLSAERRSEIARRAARARWSAPD